MVHVGGLSAAIIARSTVMPSDWHFTFNLAIAAFTLGVAEMASLDADDLGCARRHLGAGLRYGGGALLAITAIVAMAAPFGLLDDDPPRSAPARWPCALW